MEKTKRRQDSRRCWQSDRDDAAWGAKRHNKDQNKFADSGGQGTRLGVGRCECVCAALAAKCL